MVKKYQVKMKFISIAFKVRCLFACLLRSNNQTDWVLYFLNVSKGLGMVLGHFVLKLCLGMVLVYFKALPYLDARGETTILL